MSLHFPYKLIRAQNPVFPLGGRWVRPRPIIEVTIGPNDSRLLVGLLDCGSDDTVFPEAVADLIGVDLSNAQRGEAAGVGLIAYPVRYAEVTLRIASKGEFREWKAIVGFTPARLHRPLLGFAGFLQFFSANFHGDREFVELTVNSLFPRS